jgi:hypothetical protein
MTLVPGGVMAVVLGDLGEHPASHPRTAKAAMNQFKRIVSRIFCQTRSREANVESSVRSNFFKKTLTLTDAFARFVAHTVQKHTK